jgi:putative membrane protein
MQQREATYLRDLLAIDRTVLANERTLLAYGRTLLALLAAGATVMHFVTAWWAVPAGAGLVTLGVALFAFGFWRYQVVNRHLQSARRSLGATNGGQRAAGV